MLDQTTISIITAIGSICAGVAGLFAAIAAYRSAGVAKLAAQHAQQVEHRSLVRDVVNTLQSIIAESMRVDDIANKLKTANDNLALHTGNFGGNRRKLPTAETEKKQQEITPLQQEALKALEKQKYLREANEPELTNMLIKHEGQLIQIRRLKEKLSHELATIEQQIRDNRL